MTITMKDVDVSIPVSKPIEKSQLYYKVDDVPRWPTTILFGLQQLLVSVSAAVAMPLVIAELLCAGENPLARVKLIGTLMFVTGVSTIIQCTFGTRLPLLQGPAFTFLPPVIAMMSLPENKCQKVMMGNSTFSNSTPQYDDGWMDKMQVVQGGLIISSIFEIVIGFTGIIGVITKFMGPLTIAPLMILLEYSLVKVAIDYAVHHWMSGVTMLLLLILGLYMNSVNVPCLTYGNRKCGIAKFPLFAIFPYLLAISIVWTLCYILTVTNVFDIENHKYVRTDLRSHIIQEAPWFRWPYPFQWGWPKFELGMIMGMTAACIASLTESVGNYHSAARACEAPPPPLHAMNRGILMEGLCCFISAIMGGGTGVTTYSENVGVIGITKVASRRTMQVAGVIFVVLGLFTKAAAVFATVPDPLVGGILAAACAMVGGVGMSCVQMLDLSLPRNSAILGFAVMMGFAVPEYFAKVPIRTGNNTADQVLGILLSIHMFVGGVTGFILDNTIPGATKAQRGLGSRHASCRKEAKENPVNIDSDVYSFPPIVMYHMRKCRVSKYLPFLPMFRKE